MITQDPIGRTPRSNPATHRVVQRHPRCLCYTPEAKMRGYGPGRSAFNVKGGRCEECRGHGKKRAQMHFLPDIWVTCSECGGARYNRETRRSGSKASPLPTCLIWMRGRPWPLRSPSPEYNAKLQTLHDVGLDYVKLGQSATRPPERGRGPARQAGQGTEPGGHRTHAVHPRRADHRPALRRHPEAAGRPPPAHRCRNTVVAVVEHNLDVIKTADWIIDLGPEGGDAGGYIIAQGPPEAIAACTASYTGQALRPVLNGG